jgi:gamma-glutamyltranspeptidase
MSKSPHSDRFEAHRPVVMGRNGMVSTGHPLASQAGISILQKGGNAVDAAIATAAALNVVEPLMSGVGGDGFIMVYKKETDLLEICNGTGAAPYAATMERYRADGIPDKGILSVSVPGLVHSWLDAHEKHGTLPLNELMAQAIDLAENGFPVSHVLSKAIASDPLLCQFPTSRAVFTRDGRPLSPGEMLYQKDLANSFRAIVDGGRKAFYEGAIAEAIVKFSEEQGGLLTMKDLADCRSRWEEPIAISYHGHTVYEAGPNSSGHILLQELNMVEGFDLESLGCNTTESIHLMVEAKKLAFIDREAYVADPEFVDVPTQGLISKEYASQRAGRIDRAKAAQVVEAGDPWPFHGNGEKRGAGAAAARTGQIEEDTTCFVVVDRWGNAVSQLQSIQSAWGSSMIAGDTGILLNNRMTYWHMDPDHVDSLEPGKRVRHTMNPVMVFENNPPLNRDTRGTNGTQSSQRNGVSDVKPTRRLVLVCGTPGADTQVQTNLQVITHILDFGMTVAEAVESPRWRNTHSPTESTLPHDCDNLLHVEGRFPDEVLEGLKAKGHILNIVGDWEGRGSEVMIQVDPETGVLSGAADPRRDGYAIGW